MDTSHDVVLCWTRVRHTYRLNTFSFCVFRIFYVGVSYPCWHICVRTTETHGDLRLRYLRIETMNKTLQI